jgi:hypothetical protein
MTWIRATSFAESGPGLREHLEVLYHKYPPEYATEVPSLQRPDGPADSIVAAHGLIPEALRHAFETPLAVIDPNSCFNYINRVADALGVGRGQRA